MNRKVVSFTLKALKEAYVNIHSDVIWCKNKITSNFPWNTGSKQNVIQEDKFIELSSICYNIPTTCRNVLKWVHHDLLSRFLGSGKLPSDQIKFEYNTLSCCEKITQKLLWKDRTDHYGKTLTLLIRTSSDQGVSYNRDIFKQRKSDISI